MTIKDVWLAAISLLMFSAGLLVLSAWLLSRPLQDLESRKIERWSPSLAVAVAFPDSTAIDLSEAMNRPLFRPDRRPFDPNKIIAVQPTEPPQSIAPAITPAMVTQDSTSPSQLSVKGISVIASQRRALIASEADPQGSWLDQGASINGWKVSAIHNETVELLSGSSSLKLKLYVDNNLDPVGTVVPPQ